MFDEPPSTYNLFGSVGPRDVWALTTHLTIFTDHPKGSHRGVLGFQGPCKVFNQGTSDVFCEESN